MRKIQSGIYVIEILGCDKIYIGSTKNLKRRKWHHLYHLRNNNHPNIYLQNAFNKYEEKSFKFSIIVICENDKNFLLLLEQKIIDAHDFNKLFNIAKKAGCPENNRLLSRRFLKSDIQAIFDLSMEGKSNSYIAKKFNTHKSNIYDIITRKTYSDIDINNEHILRAQNTMDVNKVKIFTDEEIQIIKENYFKMTKEDLSKKIGRSKNSIFNLAKKIGLTNNKTWNKDTDQFIINNYRKIGRSECAKYLGVSVTLLSSRVHILKKKNEIV